jgi:pimeloyl-ACP methyl ester carboxylesterase
VIAALPPTLPVIAYSLRGHGQSARTLAHTRSSAISRPVFVCGHSLGGVVAAALAARLTERVQGLILEDAYFSPPGQRNPACVPWRERLTPLVGQPNSLRDCIEQKKAYRAAASL